MRLWFRISALSLVFFTSSALAQSLSCTIPLPDGIKYRVEGISEPVGDVLIHCNASGQVVAGQSYLTAEVKIFLNTTLVNRIVGSSSLTDIVLVVNENNCDGSNCAPTTVSTLGGPQKNVPLPQYGQIFSVVMDSKPFTGVHWAGVKIPIPDAKAPDGSTFPPVTTFRITNLRSNAGQLGLGGPPIAGDPCNFMSGDIGLESATVADVAAVTGASRCLIMGKVQQGLIVGGTSANLLQCQSQNIVNGAVSGPPTFAVSFREGFEYAFKPLGQPATDGGIRPGEDGYPTPGFGVNGGGANQGTRLKVAFNNVAFGVRLAVPAKVTNGNLSLQLVNTDQSGNGPYQPAAANGLVELQPSGGSAVAVYEVVSSNNTTIESADIPVVVGYTSDPASNVPGPGQATVTAGFAPSSFIRTADSSAPLPRFNDNSIPRNAFVIDRCQPQPVIRGITPGSLPAGTGVDAALRLDGSGFTQASLVEWNGSALPTKFGMDANPFLSALVSSSLTARAGTAQLDVLNPDGQRSSPVMFTITAAPPPAINTGGAVNAANSKALVARGSLASLYGVALSSSTASAAGFPLPLQLGGAKVTVNGRPAPLIYASPTQINFQVPFETPLTGVANIVVTRDGVDSAPVMVALAEFAPGIFRSGATPIVVHADYSLVTPAKPAAQGELLIAFGTGLGGLNVLPGTGAATPVNPVVTARLLPSITIGGQAAEALFAGLASGFAGLAQFNFRVPTTLPPGSVQMLVLGYGTNTDSVSLAVASGSAVTIFDNTNNSSKPVSGGYAVGLYPGSTTVFVKAHPFMVQGASYQLDTVGLIESTDGTRSTTDGGLSLFVYADSGGVPGAVLESWQGIPAHPTATLTTASSALHPVLQKGQQYWFGATTTNPKETAIWWINPASVQGADCNSANGGPFICGTNTLGAFEILGIPLGGLTVPQSGSTFSVVPGGGSSGWLNATGW